MTLRRSAIVLSALAACGGRAAPTGEAPSAVDVPDARAPADLARTAPPSPRPGADAAPAIDAATPPADAVPVPPADSATPAPDARPGDSAAAAPDAPVFQPGPGCPPLPPGRVPGVVYELPVEGTPRPGDRLLYLALMGPHIGVSKIQCGAHFHLLLPGDHAPLRGLYVRPWSKRARAGGDAEETFRGHGFGTLAMTLLANDQENMYSRGVALSKFYEAALERFAAFASRPDLANLPFVITGQSRAGVWAREISFLLPGRAIAFGNVSGWVGAPKTDAERAVVGAFVLGSETAAAEPWKMIDAVLSEYVPGRALGNPWTLAYQWGLNEHSSDNENALIHPLFEAAIRLRLPADADARAGRPALRTIPAQEAWLGDASGWTYATRPAEKAGEPPLVARTVPGAGAAFPEIAAHADFAGDRAKAVWLPDRRTAFVWRAFVATNAGLTLQATAADGKTLPTGKDRQMVIAPQAVTLSLSGSPAPASVQFYDGDQPIGAPLTAPPWRAAFTPAPGAHPVHAVWRTASGSGVARPAIIVVRPR